MNHVYIGTPICRQVPNIGSPKSLTDIVFAMSTGKRIRGLRKTLGLTQGQLAKAAGVAQASISELESGESQQPRGDTLVRVAKALQVDPDWLVSGAGNPSRAVKADTEEQQEILVLWSDLSVQNRTALLINRTRFSRITTQAVEVHPV